MRLRSTVPFRPFLAAGLVLTLVVSGTVVLDAPTATAGAGLGTPESISASKTANRTNTRVEIVGDRTETSTVYANPNGSFTLVSSLRPIRTKQGEKWVAADATLKRNADGSLSPKATLVPMRFSGGGDKAFASIGGQGRRLDLGWPATLPPPTINGATATYPNVLPGVDLRVQAEVDGFTHVLVVKDRQAAANPALAKVRFPLTTAGLSAKADPKAPGIVTAADGSGTVVLRGTAAMWDSRLTARRSGSPPTDRAAAETDEIEPRQAPVTVRIESGALAVLPDLGLLRGADTQYPVMIDPVWQIAPASLNHWSTVSTNAANPMYNLGLAASSNSYAGEVKVGKSPEGGFVVRTFFEFNTSALKYRNVSSATFSIRQLWSSSWCGDPTVRTTQLWGTYGTDASTVWNTWWNSDNSGWLTALGSSDALRFYNSGSCPAGNVDFDATGFVQRAAREGWDAMTLGLRAANEGDASSWKRYETGTAALSITYNSYPNAPDQLSVDGKACNSGAKLWSHTRTPQLRARVTDPDTGQPLAGKLYWAPAGAAMNETQMVRRASLGNPGFAQSPTTQSLADGEYYFRSYTNDEIDDSQWSAQCDFSVDATAPPKPTAVSSTLYPDTNPHGSPGQPDLFTFQPPAVRTDFDHYCYTVGDTTDATSCTPVAADANGVATTLIYPVKEGVNSLRLWSVDRAGNLSRGSGGADPDFLLYRFGVGPGSAPAAYFKLDEGTGTSTVDSYPAHADTATLAGSVAWTTGRGGRGSALNLNGSTAFAATAGPLTGRNATDTANVAVRTDQSLTVSAWVRLTTKSTNRTVVSQDGVHTGAFSLGYATSCDCWRFAVNQTDAVSPTTAQATAAGSAAVNVWTHLLGSYDSTGATVKLYVNGQLAGTAAVPVAMWNATGAVTIGRTRSADANASFWAGTIDDVRVWNRSLAAGEVKALYYPVAPIVSTVSPDVTVGTPFSVTLSSGGDTNVTKFVYYSSIANVQTVAAHSDGTPVTVQVTLTDPDVLYVGAFAYYADGTPTGTPSDAGRQDLRVHRPTSISGRIVDDSTGQPVAGATVTLQPGPRTTTTDATGRYSIAGLTPGQYRVAVFSGTSRCSLFASTGLDLGEGPTGVDLALGPQGDGYGYSCTVAAAPFVAGTTALPLANDEWDRSMEVALPFTFNYYGTDFSSLWVGTNGVAAFRRLEPWEQNPVTIPTGGTPNGVVAPLWSRLERDASSSVRTVLTGSAPNRRFVIEWHDVYRIYDSAKSRFSFEVILGEDQSLTFNYQNLPANKIAESQAVVGIESPGGMVGLQYQARQPLVANGQAITIRPPMFPQSIGAWTLSGIATRADGSPADSQNVRLAPYGQTTMTDENGRYEFTGLETGAYEVTAYWDEQCSQIGISGALVDSDLDLGIAMHEQVDAYGYWCNTEWWPRPFVPATTVLPLTGDDAYQSVSLPFPFPFYGANYTTSWVDTNGLLYFTDPGHSNPSRQRLPGESTPNNLIAPFWSDLRVDSSSSIRTTVIGQAPNRQFVIEWHDVYLPGSSHRWSFEVLLGEHGTISFNSANIWDNYQTGDAASIGIENANGTAGFQYSYEESTVNNGWLVTLHPPGVENWTVSGTVRKADGTPAVGYLVDAWEVGSESNGHSTTTDAAGHYTLTGFATGDFEIHAIQEERCGDVASTTVHLEANDVRDFVPTRKKDTYGYACTVAPATPFVPASTVVPVTLDTHASVSLPFAFTFYGITYSTAWVDGYGTLYFTEPEEGGYSYGLPFPYDSPPDNLLAAFSSMMQSDPGSSVRTSVIGQAPHRQFVIEWHDLKLWWDGALPFSAEVVLGEDGSITFNYNGVEAAFGAGTAGVENIDGTIGLSVCEWEDTLVDGEAVVIRRLTP